MKRENIFISEDYTKKRVAAVKFVAPGDVPEFECSIHFGEEGNDVTMQNCIIKNNLIVKCSPEDTYDFETGALIALMRMCGRDKVTKACDELYKDDNYKNTLQEMTENNEKLIKEFIELKKDSDKIIDKLIEENEMFKNESMLRLRDIIDLKEKYVALMAENEKLKLDCEKLQHGYNVTDKYGPCPADWDGDILNMVFLPGRACGKQYKALVELFKKTDQKKVDAAYKEAYNTTLPVWQKEVLKQACNIVMDEKEKRKSVHEWLYGPPTKREEMWENILSASKCPPVEIKVAKEDIKTFLKELQDHIPKARWNGSDCLLTEYTNPCWFNHDYIYFALFRYDDKVNLKICYDENKHSWINKPVIEYLPPMRWDLFEKGRRIVRVTPENIDDFIVKCTNKFGSIMKPVLKRYKDFTHAFIMISDYHYDNKPTIHIMTPEDLVRNQHENPKKYSDKKIVDWEDVR